MVWNREVKVVGMYTRRVGRHGREAARFGGHTSIPNRGQAERSGEKGKGSSGEKEEGNDRRDRGGRLVIKLTWNNSHSYSCELYNILINISILTINNITK